MNYQLEYEKLKAAVVLHHGQRADDRCVFDDDLLYEAAGLPPVDRRVGDKFEMAKNCLRFIEKRCEAGGWPSYKELEDTLREFVDQVVDIDPRIMGLRSYGQALKMLKMLEGTYD